MGKYHLYDEVTMAMRERGIVSGMPAQAACTTRVGMNQDSKRYADYKEWENIPVYQRCLKCESKYKDWLARQNKNLNK